MGDPSEGDARPTSTDASGTRSDGRIHVAYLSEDRLDEARQRMAKVAAGWDERLIAIKRLAEGA